MEFKGFYFFIILQVILIVLTSLLFAFTFSMEYMLITRYSLLLLLFIQAGFLVYYINRVSRKLSRFLDSFTLDKGHARFESSEKFSEFSNLYQSFDHIINSFKQLNIEKEKEYFFFSSAIQHVRVGLIGFEESGKVLLVNKAVLKLFGLNRLTDVRSLEEIRPGISKLLLSMKPAQTELISLRVDGSSLQLSLKSSQMKIEGKMIRLVSLQDIRSEIDTKEVEAWQKIIRVINHEIINSLSPVNLLSSTLLRSLEEEGRIIEPEVVDQEIIANIHDGLLAIKSRSSGLTRFVEKYRNAMQLPEPVFGQVRIIDMITNMRLLFREELSEKSIYFEFAVNPDNLAIEADQKMMEQVLINIIRNAIHALEGCKKAYLMIIAGIDEKGKYIKISDNGKGIPEDQMDSIFIPYFSTREKGSGIGLSLSKQIMHKHHGEILVESVLGKKTEFSLYF